MGIEVFARPPLRGGSQLVKPPANGRSEQPCRLALLKNPPDPNSLGILNRPLPQLEHRSLLNPSLTSYALGRNG